MLCQQHRKERQLKRKAPRAAGVRRDNTQEKGRMQKKNRKHITESAFKYNKSKGKTYNSKPKKEVQKKKKEKRIQTRSL